MNTILTLLLRYLDRRKPDIDIAFAPGSHASDREIVFRVKLTNDGTMIARDVLVHAYLDDERVHRCDPVDVPAEAEPVLVRVPLTRPDQVDLSQALGLHPVFYGRTFTVIAETGRSARRAT